ncbi:MAG: hypothetical protein GPJ54_00695 [Candidatus Heimdallarchaeota archaeon]|nr:hypothetical protein [Candidatus Heimdallarchaeota archaeon]
MKYKFGSNVAVIIAIIIVFNLFFNAQANSNLLIEQQQEEELEYTGEIPNSTLPIHFWRSLLEINDSHVFPMASLGEKGSFAGLGVAWITWSIQIEDKLVPAFAIFNRGRINEFTLLEKFYDTIYWNSVQNNLFLIGVTETETDFYQYSTEGRPFKFTLDFPSSQHEMFMTSTKFEISLLIEDTPFVVKVVGLSTILEETEDIQISSFPGIGGLYLLENQSIEVRTDKLESVIPGNFTVGSKLGHFLLNPAIYDLSLQKVWVTGNFTFSLDLPSNTINIFELGLSSSVVQTLNNSFYEYTPNGWHLITQIDLEYEVQDFSIVDIGLYFGTTVENGLEIIPAGDDADGDFIPDIMEDYFFSLPENNDSDSDTIPDGVEISFGTDPNIDDRLFDTDQDGIVNIEEYNDNLDPGNADSDFGGANDGWEKLYGFSPHNPIDDHFDNDSDGLENSIESLWNTNPFEKDTDKDKMPDAWEVQYQLDPLDPNNADLDFDNDGRTNYQEFQLNSDPLIPDPPAVFEGLYYWIFGLLILLLPVSYYYWQNYIKEDKSQIDQFEQLVDEEEIIN